MTTVYLIRHCEAQGNLHRRIHGIFNSDITPKGQRQLAYLQKRFSAVSLDAVYSSNLTRAKKTAACIAVTKEMEVLVEPQLHERSMGVWEDYSWHEIKRRSPEEFVAWRANPYAYQVPEGESEEQGGLRLHKAITALAQQNKGKTIAVVAHSMIIKIFQQIVTACGYEEIGWGENTSVSLLRVGDDNQMSFDYCNDASHLPLELMVLAKQNWSKGNSSLASYSLEYVQADSKLCARILGEKLVPERWLIHNCVVGIEDGEPVGLVGTLQTGENVELTLLFVREDRRRCGYGSQLVGEMEYRLIGNGAQMLTAHISGNTINQIEQAHFFEENSFAEMLENDGTIIYTRALQQKIQ